MIRHEGNEWVLYSHDGKKVLGRFPSKEAAERREGQVKMFKHMDGEGHAKGSTEVQTLIFDKGKYPTPETCAEWAKAHGYKSYTARETEDSIRLRQRDDDAFVSGSFRTIELKDGVKAVVGNPRGEAASLVLSPAGKFEAKGGDLFVKDIVAKGEWVHPATGKRVVFDDARLSRLAANTNAFLAAGNEIPFPDGHSFKAADNLGEWHGPFMVREGALFGLVKPKGAEVLERVADGRINRVSAYIEFNHADSVGNRYDEVITHVCATPYPVLTGQADFVRLSTVESDAGPFSIVPLIPAGEAVDAGKGVEMDRLRKVAESLGVKVEGLAEDALEAAIKTALAERETVAATAKATADAEKTALSASLKEHGLELKDGKVQKLATPPPPPEDPEKKALREELAAMKADKSKAQVTAVRARVAELVKAGKVPAAVQEELSLLLSVPAKVESLSLSKDGAVAQTQIEVGVLLDKVLGALPGWSTPLSSGGTTKETDGEALAKKGAEIGKKVFKTGEKK